jgi:hypothetical protein
MSSQIDDTKPVYGNPTTQSVRANFTTAKIEISTLQNALALAPFLPLAGAHMAGPMYLYNDPTDVMMPATKGYVDARGGTGGGGGIPEAPADGTTYGRNSGAWTSALALSGGTLTGPLLLAANPTAALGAVTKQYADAIGTQATGAVQRAGDTMTGPLLLAANPTAALGAVSKQYADAALALKAPIASPTFTGIVTAPRRVIESGTAPSLTLVDTTTTGLPVFALWNANSGFGIGPANPSGDGTAPAYLGIDGSGNITTRAAFTNSTRIVCSAAANPALSSLNLGTGAGFGMWSASSPNFGNCLVLGSTDGVGAPSAALAYLDTTGTIWPAYVGYRDTSDNRWVTYASAGYWHLDALGLAANVIAVSYSPLNMQINVPAYTKDLVVTGQVTTTANVTVGSASTPASVTAKYFVPDNNTGGMTVGDNGVIYYATWGRMAFLWNGGPVTVYANGTNIGAIQMVSDVERKENVTPSTADGLAIVRSLELIEFDYPNLSEQPGPARHFTIGFSAQQIGDVFPEAVTDPPDTDPELGLQHALNLELTPIIAATVRAIQQLTARVEALEGGSA